MRDMPVVLSHFQATTLLKHRGAIGLRVTATGDLGLSMVDVTITSGGVQFPDGPGVDWPDLEEIAAAQNSCFVVEEGQVDKILRFSEETQRVYGLMPTPKAPTLLVSGIPMHRIKGTDPSADTLTKVRSIRPVVGKVLDTATGLGYTATEAARTADHVITVELDPAVLEVARLNPWSQELFDNPKIEQRLGDCADLITGLPSGSFDRIVHDPPAFGLAGHLYGGEFYRELFRVLRRGGKLFHYIGNPESRSGETTTRGVMRRLEEAGFVRVQRQPQAFGVVAARE
jgi:predicted methyltransferase